MKKKIIVTTTMILLIISLVFAGTVTFDRGLGTRPSGTISGDVFIYNLEDGEWYPSGPGQFVHYQVRTASGGFVNVPDSQGFTTTILAGHYCIQLEDHPGYHEEGLWVRLYFRHQPYEGDFNWEDGAQIDIYFNPSL
ncbi:MAG TPA: hypothetical protein ENJ25_04060 [Firmicutes bacterium]|nr:hypothetical protein [Bacillota bacterium]